MDYIVLTEEQLKILDAASAALEVRDTAGKVCATLRRLEPTEREAIQRHKTRKASPAGVPPVSSSRVQAMMQKLDEMASHGEVTRDQVSEVLRKVHAGEDLGIRTRSIGQQMRQLN